MRDEQPILAAEREVEVIARDARDLLRVEAEQLPDAVVLVDDVIADAKLGEARERAPEPRVCPGRLFPEDLRVRQQDEPELPPHEPAPRRSDGEPQLVLARERLTRAEEWRVDLAEERLLAFRLPAVGERDDDTIPRADEALQLVLRLGDPSRRDCGTLCLEPVWLTLRKRIELRRPVERERPQALLVPDAAHVVGLPDEIRRSVDGRDEIRRRDRLVVQLFGEEVGATLRGRIHDDLIGGMERPLRERRERTNLLDLVTEELDAERFSAGRREDVHDPAADCELTAFVDTLHPFVARQREVLRQAVDAGLVADRELQRGRPRFDGGHSFGERRRRGAHQPSRREDVERPVPLAHEVGRRNEAGVVRDPASGKQRDVLGADEPARAVRRVARVGVLREQHEQPATQLLVKRREEQRQAPARTREPGSAAPARTPESDRAHGARRRRRRAVRRGCGWRPGPCGSTGIAPRGPHRNRGVSRRLGRPRRGTEPMGRGL